MFEAEDDVNKSPTNQRNEAKAKSSKNRKTITNFYFNLMKLRQWLDGEGKMKN
jgi:hypothetical protein